MTNQERLLEHATSILGAEAAKDWVQHASATLGGTPNDLVHDDEGLHRVMLHLNGISRRTPDC